MKSSHEIEQKLEQLGANWPSDVSIVDHVMRRIEVGSVQPSDSNRFRNRWRVSLPLAAAAALVAIAWWLLARVDNSLYAQALQAIENARTIHYVMRTVPANGNPAQIEVESWFERGVGFRVNLPTEVRLGDAQHYWTYRPKDKLAFRWDSRNVDELINRQLDLKRMLDELNHVGVNRFAEGDETVDGRRLTAYLADTQKVDDPAMKAGTIRVVMLLDDHSRLVRGRKEARQGDRWVTTSLFDFEYDQAIDRALFHLDFGADVRVIGADAAFDQFVSLDKAIYQDERRGIIFAIHRLERFAGHGLLVVSSVRGAPQTLEKYPLKLLDNSSGNYRAIGPAMNHFSSPLTPPPQQLNHFRIELAKVIAEGIDVCWWILLPQGTNATPYEVEPGKVKLRVGFIPIEKDFRKTFADERGIVRPVRWDAMVDLTEAKDPPSLDDISQSVYADMAALSFAPSRQLFMGETPGQMRSADTVSAAQYRAGVERYVSLLYQEDLTSALQRVFTDVSYNPLVNDFTLAEIAKHTSIKRLYLDGTKITDNGLSQLAPLKNLHELSLINTPITDAGLAQLASLTTLKELRVHGTNVTAAGVKDLVKAIPGLKVTE